MQILVYQVLLPFCFKIAPFINESLLKVLIREIIFIIWVIDVLVFILLDDLRSGVQFGSIDVSCILPIKLKAIIFILHQRLYNQTGLFDQLPLNLQVDLLLIYSWLQYLLAVVCGLLSDGPVDEQTRLFNKYINCAKGCDR